MPVVTQRIGASRAGALTLVVCATTVGRAAADEPPLEDMSIEQLMDVEVETATKEPRPAREAPSIVSVITREDIRVWGFNSVAEALALVPGIYCIDDYTAPDCGVRGINGGDRGYSKILRVMIDGQPVSFRSDTTNFLGPELIPIELVERIEVVRGPVSALYGANAFYGAINVITRDERRATAGGRVRVNDDRGAGIDALFLAGGADWNVTLGASGVDSSYDGRRLPRSSPDIDSFVAADNLESRDARTRPMSAFGKAGLHVGALDLGMLARYGELDSVAEFLDFGPLSHDNRVVLRTIDARVQARYSPWQPLSLTGSLAVADGRPGADERLSTGAADTFPRRKFGYRAYDAVLEGRLHLFDDDSLTLGLDYTRDDEDLIEVFTVDRQTGVEMRTSDAAGHRMLTNAGVYAQAIYHPVEVIGITGNIRYDRHNVYGAATHYRLGAVWTPSAHLAGKLLYGTSFKAPAALQLFSQPLVPGEVIGNDDLRPETAHLFEAALIWRPTANLAFTADAFLSEVRDKVELVPVATNLQPTNVAREDGKGVEAEARWVGAGHAVEATLAFEDTTTGLSNVFLGEVDAPSERYPRLTEQLRWHYNHPFWGMPGIALRYASQRRASAVNIRDNLQVPYALPRYLVVDLVYSRSWGPHSVHVRLDNALDSYNPEPGFGGIDLPARGRHLWLSYSFSYQQGEGR